MTRIYGWDLGGANIKLAVYEDATLKKVVQIPCPIVPDRRKFDEAVGVAMALVTEPGRHAATMTGELSDVFTDRADGVAYLISLMERVTAGQPLSIYAGSRGLLTPSAASEHVADVASANWHATGALLATRLQNALLADIGTTTTDLIAIAGGRVACHGFTDAERLASGELVYTGVVRTPVMAVAQAAPFHGRIQRIAAERFATMADVYRLTAELPLDSDPYPSADSRGKGLDESAARLARMLGRDASEAPLSEWASLARYFADCQLALIEKAAREVGECTGLPAEAPVVGAGSGRFAARHLAERLGRPYVDFAEIIEAPAVAKEMAARCAPAVAVALLAASGA